MLGSEKAKLSKLGILVTREGQIADRAKLHIEAPANISGTISMSGVIGAHTYIRRNVTVDRCSHIGRYCSIAQGAVIGHAEHPTSWLSSHPFQYGEAWVSKRWSSHQDFAFKKPELKGGTYIGHDVTVGINAIVMRGVHLGTGSIIQPGTVVTQDVPPFAIIEGIPGRIVGWRHSSSLIKKIIKSRWWRFEADALLGLPFDRAAKSISELNKREKEGSLKQIEDSFILVKEGKISKRNRRSWLIEEVTPSDPSANALSKNTSQLKIPQTA